MKLILSLFVILSVLGGTAAAQPFPRSYFFAVKPDCQLIVIEGRVYCWHSKAASGKPYEVWTPKLPELPDGLVAKWIQSPGRGGSAGKADDEAYYLKLGPSKANSKNFLYLATDEKSRAIAATEKNERAQWRLAKEEDRWRESRTDPDDIVNVFEFRAVSGPPEANYLGLAEKPRIVKDKQGKEVEFFPLLLTDKSHAAHFAYNDYSGK